MIAAQATVAMVLAIGATFLIRSHANLWSQDTGYAADARIVAVSYPRTISPGRLAEDALACMESLRRIPGVSDVAAAIGVGTLLDDFAVFGGDRIRTHDGSFFLMPTSKVTSNYFDVVGTPFIAGRAFAADDRLWSGVVVTDVFARRLWPDRTATEVVGESVVVMDASLAIDHVAPIVGVVAGVRDRALDRPPVARLYRPLDIGTSIPRRMNYAIRSTSSVVPIGEITRVVSTVTPGAYVERVDAVGTLLSETVKDRTFVTLVATLFGVASVGVTCGGVLAVVSFAAARRTREMAIRAALGARPNAIRYLILGPSLGAAFVGAAIGWVIARLSTAAIEAYLYGVGADSLSVPIVAGLTLMVLTGAAAWWPTRRVIRAQPSAVLRID